MNLEKYSMDEKNIPTTAKPGFEEDDQDQDRLSSLLSSIQSGWKVTILREQPGWCRGHLETIEYYGADDNEPIDVDYLIRQWGGRKLHLKVLNDKSKWVGGGSISLFTYPPKIRGQLLHEADMYGMSPGPQGTFNPAVPQPPYPIPQTQPQNGFDVAKLFELASKQKNADMGSIMELMRHFQTQMPQPQQVDPMAGMQQMMGMAQAFKQMQEIFGNMGGDGGGGGGGGGGDDGIAPIAAEVVKALVSQQQRPAAPARGVLTGPRPGFTGPPKNGDPPQNAPPTPPQNAPPTKDDIESGNIMQIAKHVSDLDPEDAAGCVHLAFDGMPKEKRDQAAAFFMSQMQEEDDDGQGPR